MIILDTSAVIELLLNLPLGKLVRQRLTDPDVQIHAPQLLPVEVVQVLRRRVAAGITTPADAGDALEELEQLDISLHDHMLLIQRVWELRENMTSYDGMYVALAELLEAPLLTSDAKLARSPGTHADIELLHLRLVE